jgi:hypothetical protein
VSDAWGPLDRLVAEAEALAGAWGARARASTTIGQERAILRLFGVSGLDGGGRPLAGTTVDRWLAGDDQGLGGGIALPFAMALLEYDLDPQQLALDVASGAVDLAPRPRSSVNPTASRRRGRGAGCRRGDRTDRCGATARHETIAMLGDAARPWLGRRCTSRRGRGPRRPPRSSTRGWT